MGFNIIGFALVCMMNVELVHLHQKVWTTCAPLLHFIQHFQLITKLGKGCIAIDKAQNDSPDRRDTCITLVCDRALLVMKCCIAQVHLNDTLESRDCYCHAFASSQSFI